MVAVQTNEGNELELEVKVITGNGDEQYEVTVPPAGWIGITEAAELAEYQRQYMRKLVLDGKVEAVKVTRKGFNKWFVNPESLEEYQSQTVTRGGMRRFIFKTDLDNEPAVREVLDGLDIDYELELQYQPKSESEAEAEVETEADEVLDFLSE